MADETFPERLKRLLDEKHFGKSETAWARESGVDFNTIRAALDGATQPRHSTLEKLAAYCDVSIEYLVTGEGSPDPPPADLAAISARVDEALELLIELREELRKAEER